MNKIGSNLSACCTVLCYAVLNCFVSTGVHIDRVDLPSTELLDYLANVEKICQGVDYSPLRSQTFLSFAPASSPPRAVLHLRLLNHDGAKSRAAMSKIVGIPKLYSAKFYA